ncbi:ATP-binding protein [Hydrogenophaga sp. OTU3427]|uniref:ATP-binding protein n=1 Tax=Hydrogenophaga sp. OTU3427 TaxID=3043856 RepID=UPI00313B1E51
MGHTILANPLRESLDRVKNNPLIAAFPKKLTPVELALQLRFCPITPENLAGIPLQERMQLLTSFRSTFIPTVQGLSICLSLQQMIFDGYMLRDPLLAASRKFIFTAGQLKGQKLADVQWWPSFASGMVIDGITGMGKSQLVDRFLSLYPQVVEHGENEECGWKFFKQLCWLKVHMPSDGSRGGFMEGAFRELDNALGTSYSDKYSSKSWSVEKLLVVFLHLLSVHRCGLLVIEEAQERNLSQSPFSREFVTFFLRLLNWGTPTVLIGNPLAFANLNNFSQDVDRFSEGGWYHLLPTLDPTSEEWLEDWIPGLWSPTLLDQPDAEYIPFSKEPYDQTLAGFVWRRTGGVPRYLARLRIEVQDAALRQGARQVTPELVDQIYRTSPKMIEVHERIDAFVRRDWHSLKRFNDISWEYFRKLWSTTNPAEQDQYRAAAPAEQDPSRKVKFKQRTPTSKPRPTKDNPTPSDRLSAAEIRARKFQEATIQSLTQAAGFLPE